MGMSVQRRLLQELPPKNKKKKGIESLFRDLDKQRASSESHLAGLICLTGHTLLPTSLADLIGTDPLALDRPSAEALVVGVVPSKVTVFDQTTARVPAREVNDFILAVCQRIPGLGECLSWKETAYLAHDCSFAANRRILLLRNLCCE